MDEQAGVALEVTEVETMGQYRERNSRIYCSVKQVVLFLLNCAVNQLGNCKYACSMLYCYMQLSAAIQCDPIFLENDMLLVFLVTNIVHACATHWHSLLSITLFIGWNMTLCTQNVRCT